VQGECRVVLLSKPVASIQLVVLIALLLNFEL
jgi:hypothetical protein